MDAKPLLAARGQLYVYAVVIAGFAAIAESFYQLHINPVGKQWLILAALTLISGSATVRLVSVPATISISETFVFTSILLFGGASGTIIVALDGLVISLWISKKRKTLSRLLFNIACPALSIWLAAHVFFLSSGVKPLFIEPVDIGQIVGPLILLTLVHFLVNSWLITFAVSSETGTRPFHIWRRNFLWLSLNYFGGASVAALFVTYNRQIDIAFFAVIVPLLVVIYFTFRSFTGRVEDGKRHLEELNSLYMSTVETLAMAIDAKDQITHGHIRRVQVYAVGLARTLGLTDEKHLKAVEAAALLHDMGKLAVPEYILNKPGKLTSTEFDKMKLHATVGADILSAIDFPYPVVPIVRHHHESWDGSGYPAGLKGEDIPIGARILAVADCFDALTSDRPYRPRLSDADALKILVQRRGTMYDPAVVDCFIKVYREIAPQHMEHPVPKAAFTAISDAAQPLTPALDSSRLDDISASTEEMLTLYDLARGLTGQMNLADSGDVIAKHLRRMLPASLCAFYVYDADSDELVLRHAAGENAELFASLRIPLGQRLTGWVGANRTTILNSDPVLDFGEVARSLKPRPRSCLSTPLLVDTQLVGVLTLYSNNRDAFTEDHRRIIEVVARQVSHAIRHAIVFDEDRHSSLRDTLTGLPNREHLERFFQCESDDRGHIRQQVTLLLIAVDGLKSINASFGRAAGDNVLEQIVMVTRRALRGADILFRYGSDDFVILLTQTDSTSSMAVVDRIREGIDGIKERNSRHPDTVAVSIGIATAPADGKSLDQLVEVAKGRLSFKPSDPQFPSDPSASVH